MVTFCGQQVKDQGHRRQTRVKLVNMHDILKMDEPILPQISTSGR